MNKLCLLLCCLTSLLHGQQDSLYQTLTFFQPSETFHKARFCTAVGGGLATYTAFSVGFYNAWYKDYPQSPFHLFDDSREWRGMDKGGHVFSGYFQSLLTYKGSRWAGIQDHKAIWTGIGIATLFQSTIEVMDGLSAEWGFSLADIGANTVGVAAFGLQQRFWKEQRIQLKESAWPVRHPTNRVVTDQNGQNPVSLRERAYALYGSSWGEKVLKDYNAQTYWASLNVASFLPQGNSWPKWLNIGLGVSAGGMYGGFANVWQDGASTYDASHIQRYTQFLIAPDIDLTKINTRYPFIKTLLSIGNIFKMPSPAIEYNTLGQWHLHLIYY